MRVAKPSPAVAGCPVALLAAVISLLTLGLASACGLARWTETPSPHGTVRTTRQYMPGYAVDVLTPSVPPRAPAPVVVTMHSCCGSRADLAVLAEGLAAAGAVVLNADWVGIRPGGYPLAYRQASCLVRTARRWAAAYGGDPRRVTLLGWGDGAMIGAVAALDAEDFQGGCPVAAGSPLPDAFVGVSAFLGWPVGLDGRVDAGPFADRAGPFFGGDPQSAAGAWRAGDPYAMLDRRPGFPMSLVTSVYEPLLAGNRRFAAAARARCHPVAVTAAPYDGDPSMIAPRTEEGRTTIRVTLAAAAGGGGRAPGCSAGHPSS